MLPILLALSTTAFAVPTQLGQQGRLLDTSGVAISGTHGMTFRFFDSETGGAALWEEVIITQFEGGYYNVVLGANVSLNPLEDSVLQQNELYLEIQVDAEPPLSPRQSIGSSPYARIAGKAMALEGPVDADSVSVNGNLVIDSNGSWVGPTVSLSWNDLQNIPADLADGDDDSLAGLQCSSGQIVGWSGQSWVCTDDNGLTESQVEAFITNDPIDFATGSTLGGLPILTEGDGDTLSGLSCQSAEVAKFDAVLGQWSCDVDQDTVLTEGQVEGFITNNAIDLSPGGTMGGMNLVTTPGCADGEFLTFDSSSNAWQCQSPQSLFDQDGDGVFQWDDCNDADPSILDNSNDNDCDGVLYTDDCNDFDPNSYTVAVDADCDGILTADDCDDTDSNSGSISNDADCDGSLTSDDCDDNNDQVAPGLQEICGDGLDNDCIGGDDSCFSAVTFTNCGSQGINGPDYSECVSAYATTALANLVTVTSGYQYYIVQQTGTYVISAYGAQGGMTYFDGGNGAFVSGEFSLTAGEELKILVGQMGTDGDSGASGSHGGGGGGGTYVSYSDNTPLLVAGGGGGATAGYQCNQYYGTQCIGGPGQVSDIGNGSGCGGSYGNCAGSGWSSNGGGYSFLNGGVGGYSNNYGVGGFGGGGGSQSHPGGGGGGYHGGNCGNNFPTLNDDTCSPEGQGQGSNGRGGFSYNAGSNPTGTSGFNSGHGWVHIELQ